MLFSMVRYTTKHFDNISTHFCQHTALVVFVLIVGYVTLGLFSSGKFRPDKTSAAKCKVSSEDRLYKKN